MAASSTLLARLKAGLCFNSVEVWLLTFWEARNDSFAINSESMEGSLVLALILNEASSPVSRLSPTKLESSMLVNRKKIPTSRFTYQKALASKTYVGTSFAGPWMEDKPISSWWMVDLGEDHQVSSITSLSIASFVFLKTHAVRELHNLGNRKLMCNYYNFRRWVKSMHKVLKVSGINRWENMDGPENSTVTSVENYTVMKWHVDCLHYTHVPFNYHI
ncbi:hypothetical protein IGI04_006763 [Brassica rapa subsp. trilocularis]|uniref:F5/8 type C domain-containing protein n=1 Tax=Brassica rapa subsp. trilocularis TaxID=1813537 RepID=A0ABQ7NL14_BRACM|nr:hypothetical protein IGI04_006763 [Brassica rapa subsp. trilocularis]